MNDRFKFRVWDKKTNKYIKKTHHQADTCLDGLTGKVLYGEGIEIYGNKDDCDVVIEQCTGLKDKNGKLIYEGDVVKINGWWDACGPAGYSENKCVVEYDEEVAGFTPMCNYDCDCGVYHYAKDCEVIGNIHDELLEQSKDKGD